jgi:C1A family cysteine protease
MQYVEQYGQVTESEYPYTAGHGQSGSCQSSKISSPSVHVSAVNTVQRYSASQLIAAIAQGPVSVTVEADKMAFQGYTGGILNSAACGTNLDHAITAVGYGEKNGQQYYIVRNSWGPTWGDQGYIMIAAVEGTAGICGIQQTSVWPNMK